MRIWYIFYEKFNILFRCSFVTLEWLNSWFWLSGAFFAKSAAWGFHLVQTQPPTQIADAVATVRFKRGLKFHFSPEKLLS